MLSSARPACQPPLLARPVSDQGASKIVIHIFQTRAKVVAARSTCSQFNAGHWAIKILIVRCTTSCRLVHLSHISGQQSTLPGTPTLSNTT